MRIQLDQLQADGTLAKLKRPLYVFTGLQFEEKITEVDGDVIMVGDCAKGMKDRFPDAQYWGELHGISELHADLGESAGCRHRALRASPAAGPEGASRLRLNATASTAVH